MAPPDVGGGGVAVRAAGLHSGTLRETGSALNRGVLGNQQRKLLRNNPRSQYVRPLTDAELTADDADEAMKRLLKTPRVFQSSNEGTAAQRRRELRANLLPSILRAPSEMVGGGEATLVGPTEIMGNFHKLYKEQMEQRERVELESKQFLERDQTLLQPEFDPQQMVAASCSPLKELVADRLKCFRRPIEGFINTTCELPFTHPDQATDLKELSDILTLDLEHRDISCKGTAKRPGFMTFQIASRVPLVVRDPLALGDAHMESEKLAANDLHVVRLDLYPGEVRQIAYALGSREFKRSDLGCRMAALVDPERGVLAGVVKALRKKELEGGAIVSVLNDMLRNLPGELPPAPEPKLEAAGEEDGPARRMESLIAGPRHTLSRLLEALQSLSTVAAPIMPCLAHALDRVSLICVREVDRLAARCHEDYERLLQCWAKAEASRQEQANLVDRMSGRATSDGASGGVEHRNRIQMLEQDLTQQEQMYSHLLKEKNELQSKLEESIRQNLALRQRIKQLEATVASVRANKGGDDQELLPLSPRRASMMQFQSLDAAMAASNSVISRDNSESVARRISNDAQAKRVGGDTPVMQDSVSHMSASPRRISRAGVSRAVPAPVHWAVHQGTQTDTEHYFSDNHPMGDELSFAQYSAIMRTAGRLYGILAKYDWNTVAAAYLLTTREDDGDSGMEDNMLPVLSHKHTSKSTTSSAHHSAVYKMHVLRSIKQKVERAQQKSHMAQLEEEIGRLQAGLRGSFEAWVVQAVQDHGAASKSQPTLEQPVNPDDLFQLLVELVQADGMRRRIQQLEDHLSSLLPLAERARTGLANANEGTDGSFWRRVMRVVRQQQTDERRNSSSLERKATRKRSIESLMGPPAVLAMDKVQVLAEIAAIWSSLTRPEERARFGMSKLPAQQALQAAIKTFYLRKTGRSKHVESSVIHLCRAVLEHISSHNKIALFAIAADIQPAIAMGDRIPRVRREVGRDADFKFNPEKLADLPLDAAQCLSALMRELKMLRRSKKYNIPGSSHHDKDDEGEAGDAMLPIQLVLAAGRTVLGCRSRATARFFELAVFAYTEFPTMHGVKQPSYLHASTLHEDGLAAHDLRPREHDDGEAMHSAMSEAVFAGPGGAEELLLHEVLFTSHLLHAHFLQQRQTSAMGGHVYNSGPGGAAPRIGPAAAAAAAAALAEESEAVEDLWKMVIQEASSMSGLRKAIGLIGPAATCSATKAAQALVKLGTMHLPSAMVARALVGCHAGTRHHAENIEVRKATLERLHGAWKQHGGEGSALCRESLVLWAALWALAHERSHEMDLMGKLYTLFDTSGDGWLQYEEFAELMSSISPEVSQAESEELFLCGAEEVTGDMTQEVFIGLVSRLGISADIDLLEHLVAHRRVSLYGERSDPI